MKTSEQLINFSASLDDPWEVFKEARVQFPQILDVLGGVGLLTSFSSYEKEAHDADSFARTLGFIVAFSLLTAFLGVAAMLTWSQDYWMRSLALFLETGGASGALIALGGLRLGDWRRTSLSNWFLSERLRQWHFQLLVRRGQQIEASFNSPEAAARFQTERNQWLHELFETQRPIFSALLHSVPDEGDLDIWLHPAFPYASGSEVLPQVFGAYEILRFDHELHYAELKVGLLTRHRWSRLLTWPAIYPNRDLSATLSMFLGLMTGCATTLAVADILGFSKNIGEPVRIGVLLIAFIGALLIAIQQAFTSDQEIEHYKEYVVRTSHLRDRFRESIDPSERLHIMEEMEVAVVEKMRRLLAEQATPDSLLSQSILAMSVASLIIGVTVLAHTHLGVGLAFGGAILAYEAAYVLIKTR